MAKALPFLLPLEEPPRRPQTRPNPIFVRNWEAGFQRIWTVAERYTVENGLLKPHGEPLLEKMYAPAVEESLPGQLAAVQRGEIPLEEFAATFGLLGRDHLLPLELRLGGDPVEWVLAHARSVDTIIEILGVLRENDHYALRDILENLGPRFARGIASGPDVREAGSIATYYWDPVRDASAETSDSERARDVSTAHVVLRYLINPNIRGIRRELGEAQGRSRSFFSFNAMIEVVYWRLANETEHSMVRRCEECGHFFIARDKRQRYCPAVPGVLRSRCGVRKNVHDFRDRQHDLNVTHRPSPTPTEPKRETGRTPRKEATK